MDRLQAAINAMSASAAETRSHYHLTLGALIDFLERIPEDTLVAFEDGTGPKELRSYRGYYADLAFSSQDEPVTAGALLKLCLAARGKAFEGYKGGDYRAHDKTSLWSSEWGDVSGDAITSISGRDRETIILVRRNVD